MKIAEILITIQ